MFKNVSLTDQHEIVALWRSGIPMKETAPRYGISLSTAFRILKAHTTADERILPAPPKEELYDLYITQNKTNRQVAEHYGTTHNVVTRWLRISDIKKPMELKQAYCRIPVPSDDELYTLYIVEGYTRPLLAAHYGVGKTLINTWLNEAEIKKHG